MATWHHRAILAELRYHNHSAMNDTALVTFIIKSIIRIISSATPLDTTRYKHAAIRTYVLASDDVCQALIGHHRAYLTDAMDLPVTSDVKGVMSDIHIQRNIHLFVSYGIWLQRTTQSTEADVVRRTNLKQKQEPKAPFQVIPQLTLKVRFLSFGNEQILEFLKLLIGNPDVQKLFSYDDLQSIEM